MNKTPHFLTPRNSDRQWKVAWDEGADRTECLQAKINCGSAEKWMASVLPQKQHAGTRMKNEIRNKGPHNEAKAGTVHVCNLIQSM